MSTIAQGEGFTSERVETYTGLITVTDDELDLEAMIAHARGLAVEHGVVVVRGLQLASQQDFMDFGNQLGKVQPRFGFKDNDSAGGHIQTFQRFHDGTGIVPKSDESSFFPHFDYVFSPEIPHLVAMHAVQVPPSGGDTCFKNTEQAYEALRARVGAIFDDLQVCHSLARAVQFMRRRDPSTPDPSEYILAQATAWHMLTPQNPITGHRAVLWSNLTAEKIVGGLPESNRYIEALLREHFEDPAATGVHEWQEGDIAVVNNRSTLHWATPSSGGDRKLDRIAIMLTDTSGDPSKVSSGSFVA